MTEDEPRQDPGLPEDARLRSLDRRLKQAQAQESARTGTDRRARPKGQAQGSRILADLFGMPFGSALIGWLIDRWFGTTPIFLLALLFLGFCGAIWNVYKISKQRPE
jgi:ATP synthase protein I